MHNSTQQGPTYCRLAAERAQRLARMAAAAMPDPGINLKRTVLGWRGPPSARPREPEPPPPEPPPPEPPPPEPAPPEPVALWPEGRAHQIIRVVCERFGLSPDEISSKLRIRTIVVPRHMCMALLRELTTLSMPAIGRLLGGFDHTTVLSALKRIDIGRAHDPWIASHYDKLIVKLRSLDFHEVERKLEAEQATRRRIGGY
jgi:hypothetical protein